MAISTIDTILNAYPHSDKVNTIKRRVITVKAKDRVSAQIAIEKQLKLKKLAFYRKKDSALSGSTEVTVIDTKDKPIILVFKPESGGMQETTLNSTITELAPSLAFEAGYKPKDVKDFYKFLKGVDHSKSNVYVIDRDRIAGKKFIDDFPNSSKFEEKMNNAIAVLDYLQKEHKKQKISQVYWAYRAKPDGVDDKHKGDIFIKYANKKMIGLSLKAGGEKTKEPKLNTYVNPVFEALDTNAADQLRASLYNSIYKQFVKDKDNYDKGKSKQEVLAKLVALEKNDLTEYDKLYDKGLSIIRDKLIKVISQDTEKTVTYLTKAIIGKETNVPLIVLKAFGKKWQILTDEDEVGAFLPKVKKVTAYIDKANSKSKQDFFIELKRSETEKLKLKFAVRTNKTGSEHKLGQFFNLAVKFNGVV
jgi:hypothetical protein